MPVEFFIHCVHLPNTKQRARILRQLFPSFAPRLAGGERGAEPSAGNKQAVERASSENKQRTQKRERKCTCESNAMKTTSRAPPDVLHSRKNLFRFQFIFLRGPHNLIQ